VDTPHAQVWVFGSEKNTVMDILDWIHGHGFIRGYDQFQPIQGNGRIQAKPAAKGLTSVE
jgi:hypothetical protein